MTGNFKDSIPVEELTLGNGDVVVFYTYLTMGESRELQKLLLEGSKIDIDQKKVNEIPAQIIFTIQDKLAEYLIKGIKGKDNIKPYTKEWLDNLSVVEGNKVVAKLNAINEESNMAPSEKKA